MLTCHPEPELLPGGAAGSAQGHPFLLCTCFLHASYISFLLLPAQMTRHPVALHGVYLSPSRSVGQRSASGLPG